MLLAAAVRFFLRDILRFNTTGQQEALGACYVTPGQRYHILTLTGPANDSFARHTGDWLGDV